MGTVEFLDKYGILVVTTLYFLATVWYTLTTRQMARVMRDEFRLKTHPVLGLCPAEVDAQVWQSLEIRQRIVNGGLGLLTIDKATFQWSESLATDEGHAAPSLDPLPCHLAPGQSVTLTFRLTREDLRSVANRGFDSAAELIHGIINYQYHGVDGSPKRMTHSPPLPSRRDRPLASATGVHLTPQDPPN